MTLPPTVVVESVTKHCPAVHVPAHVEGVHGGAPLSGLALSGMPLSTLTLSALPLRELEQPIEKVATASHGANRKKDTQAVTSA